jgi:uncharacterized protein (TIGR00369 family)
LEIESPFLKLLGAHLEEWRDGYARVSLNVSASLLNRSGMLQGGVLATLLDHAGGLCGLYCVEPENRRYGVTLSLTCNFTGQAKTGRIDATATRSHAGRSVYFATTEVRSHDGRLIATGASTHKFRTGSEDAKGVKPRGVENNQP